MTAAVPDGEPRIAPGTAGLRTVVGTFHRGVDPRFRAAALDGSRSAGRFSRPGAPALYLSATPEGVAAAMLAHARNGDPEREVLRFHVRAERIVDLRDPASLAPFGIEPEDAAAPWQEAVARGEEPPSWRVRDRLDAAGAHGLIDPSRQRPGLWHLVLFRWNVPGAPSVRAAGGRPQR
ncbi:RES domain-containing protein [Agrococcus sediminis]|uniref:RES domain-containing protein n=1 Tax=Agrococcus sediminis TaxID=2599924 RepID=UPI001F0B78B5